MTQAAGNGMAGMFEISFFALFLRGVIGVIQDLGGVDWVVPQDDPQRQDPQGCGVLHGRHGLCV